MSKTQVQLRLEAEAREAAAEAQALGREQERFRTIAARVDTFNKTVSVASRSFEVEFTRMNDALLRNPPTTSSQLAERVQAIQSSLEAAERNLQSEKTAARNSRFNHLPSIRIPEGGQVKSADQRRSANQHAELDRLVTKLNSIELTDQAFSSAQKVVETAQQSAGNHFDNHLVALRQIIGGATRRAKDVAQARTLTLKLSAFAQEHRVSTMIQRLTDAAESETGITPELEQAAARLVQTMIVEDEQALRQQEAAEVANKLASIFKAAGNVLSEDFSEQLTAGAGVVVGLPGGTGVELELDEDGILYYEPVAGPGRSISTEQGLALCDAADALVGQLTTEGVHVRVLSANPVHKSYPSEFSILRIQQSAIPAVETTQRERSKSRSKRSEIERPIR